MSIRIQQILLGAGTCAAALFLTAFAIPAWISAPSNVSNLILSPLFWPYSLAGCAALVGLGLIATSFRLPKKPRLVVEGETADKFSWPRLGALAAVMIATFFLIPWLGMVWASMLCFALTALLTGIPRRGLAIVCAVVLPLVLYAFFAHVAGVAIPQGVFVRLP